MTYLVEFTLRAEFDLKRLYSKKNAAESMAARRWFIGLERAISGLEMSPRRCPLAPEAAEANLELRHLLYGKKPHVYRILYQVDEARKTVWLLTIRHGARKSLTALEL
jgi:mRNA-degrading endonuclease RelE of RelBE toxin-antitoxin system